jgi:hypothetical protein
MPKKFSKEVIRTRNLLETKETTIKITNDKNSFEIHEIKDIVEKLEKDARAQGKEITTIVRIPAIIGMRTVRGLNGVWYLDEYEEYLEGKVEDVSKFEKLAYFEITVKTAHVQNLFKKP